MTAHSYGQIVFFFAFVVATAVPLGHYMARVYAGEPVALEKILGPLERLLYRLALGQPNQEDFVNVLMASHADKFPILRQLALDLSAFGREKNQSGEQTTMTPPVHEATMRARS